MAGSVLVDASFLVALLSERETHHGWAAAEGKRHPPPWQTCEPVLSETFHLLGHRGGAALVALLRRDTVAISFRLDQHLAAVLRLLEKYADVPMGLADACLVRMTELLPDPILLTLDEDFRVYRRHSRQTVPCVTPR